MKDIIESVPNFSEGRDLVKIEAIKRSLSSVDGAKLLYTDIGYDANRTVFTLAGAPLAVFEALYQGIKTAIDLLDMRVHVGAHPRIGVCDVCPIIPVSNEDTAKLKELIVIFGDRLGSSLGIPVYFYEQSAQQPHKTNLADIRKGEYEGLALRMQDPDWHSDNGQLYNPSTGATVLGLRSFLVAYNINLDTKEASKAKQIASLVRQSSTSAFKLAGVKAIGWFMPEFGCAQVSTNIVNIDEQNLYTTYKGVAQAAQYLGVSVTGAELIALIPEQVLDSSLASMRLDYPNDEVNEMTLIKELSLDFNGYFSWDERIIERLL